MTLVPPFVDVYAAGQRILSIVHSRPEVTDGLLDNVVRLSGSDISTRLALLVTAGVCDFSRFVLGLKDLQERPSLDKCGDAFNSMFAMRKDILERVLIALHRNPNVFLEKFSTHPFSAALNADAISTIKDMLAVFHAASFTEDSGLCVMYVDSDSVRIFPFEVIEPALAVARTDLALAEVILHEMIMHNQTKALAKEGVETEKPSL